MNFVIIWQDIPERLRVYTYETSDDIFMERIERCHRNLVGCSEEHIEADIMWLGELLGGTYTPGKTEDDTPLFTGGLTPAYDSERDDNCSCYMNTGGKLIVTGMLM